MSLRFMTLGGVLVLSVAWSAPTHRFQQAKLIPDVALAEVKTTSAVKKSPTHFHTAAVRAFGQTPGFGRGRMPIMMHEIEDVYVDWSPGELDSDGPPIEVPELAKAHRKSSAVLARDPVAWLGLPAQVASLHGSGPAQHWRLQKIDLVALVDHDDPAVYITAKLPWPNEDGVVPKQTAQDKARYTRPLDFLEIAALEKLMHGDELFVRTKDTSLRMVGALRASKQCLECHSGKEGDLFGAFSYSLEKVNR